MKNLLVVLLLFIIANCGQKTEQAEQTKRTQDPHSKATGSLMWTPPEGWIQEMPRSAMRKAQYRLPRVEGDTEDASAAIFHFPGGGSIDANLKRWYAQFTQPDGKSSDEVAKVSKSTVNGLNLTTVDLAGTYKPASMEMPSSAEKPNFRMLAGVVETDAGPWFVKAIGPEKTMAQWEDSFHKFMETFKE